MSQDVRTKRYPPLPTGGGGARMSVVLPTQGDLRLRPLLPAAFVQSLAIHCNAESHQVYARFLLERRFIVMSRDGNLFTQTSRMTLRIEDLPGRALLPLPPPLAAGDVASVLDLVQCYTFDAGGVNVVPHVRWELVRVRWRNGRETWIPIELMASQPPALLQEWYVNCINSWGFHDRVYPQSLQTYSTEVELWLHQPEFQPFYQQLRRRAMAVANGGGGSAQPTNSRGPAAAPATTDQSVDVKDCRLVAEAARVSAAVPPGRALPPATTSTQPPPPPQALSTLVVQPPPPPAPSRPPPQQQNQQQPPPHQHSNGSRIPHSPVSGIARLPPLPPTPPRPSLERSLPPPPPGFTLAPRNDPQRQQQAQPKQKGKGKEKKQKHKHKEKETDNHKEKDRHKAKEQHTSKSPDRERRSKNVSKDDERRRQKEARAHREQSPARTTERESHRRRDKTQQQQREVSPETPRTRKRRRKRLKWSQAADDSDVSDDVLEELTLRDDADEEEAAHKQKKKQRKRLRKASEAAKSSSNGDGSKDVPIIVLDDDDDEDDDDEAAKIAKEKKERKRERKTKKKRREKKEAEEKQKDREKNGELENGEVQEAEQEVAMEIDVADFSDGGVADSDADDEIDGANASQHMMMLGEIRCVCDAVKVGRYTGQWVQCWKEDCGVWQHAECVGLLVRRGDFNQLPEKYCCSVCDAAAYEARCETAKSSLRLWLSLCCENRNQKHFFKLLEDEDKRQSSAANELAASTFGSLRLTLLMEAARYGLAHAVRRLVRRYKVNVHALDSHSRNALHHAVLGDSLATTQFLQEHSPALVSHQDLSGQMPLHLMLRSAALNLLCLPLLKKDSELCVTSDFAGHMPIHFACEVVNQHTVEIVRQILGIQPNAGLEGSPERLTPLMYLCDASAASSDREMTEKSAYVEAIVDMLLDVDVLGGFFNARDPRGWTPLHFVTETGNHTLLRFLCKQREVEIDAITFDSGETALHLAARANEAKCVRVLLENARQRLDVAAVDGSQWIPVLRTTDASCMQLLLYYYLDRQLQRVSTLARSFRHHEVLRRWMDRVVSDATSYAILNDWLQSHLPLLDELDEVMLLHRSFVRIDAKLDFLYQTVFASLRRSSKRRTARPPPLTEDAPQQPQQATDSAEEAVTRITLSSSSGECYWKQFVSQTRDFDGVVFRHKLRVEISRGGSMRLDNLTLVLVRLLSGLLQPTTGLLVRNEKDGTLSPSSLRAAGDAETLREYYVLGELIAYLVLCEVSLGEVFEFSTPFLENVLGLRDKSPIDDPSTFAVRVFGESFAAGFEAVAPVTLALLHAEELRILLNARKYALNLDAADWAAAVEWVGFVPIVSTEEGVEAVSAWWARLMTELVDEEQVAMTLWLTGSFRHAQSALFVADAANPQRPSVRIQRFSAAVDGGDNDPMGMGRRVPNVDDNELLPVLDAASCTLVMPQYSSYDRFRSAVLRVFRRANPTTSMR